jgi:hypothetical protein
MDDLLTDTARLLWCLYGQMLLGVAELAQILRLSSKAAVHNALHRGRLDGLRIIRIGGRIYADVRDVADYLDGQRDRNKRSCNDE